MKSARADQVIIMLESMTYREQEMTRDRQTGLRIPDPWHPPFHLLNWKVIRVTTRSNHTRRKLVSMPIWRRHINLHAPASFTQSDERNKENIRKTALFLWAGDINDSRETSW